MLGVHPVAILSAVCCVNFKLLIFVMDASGDYGEIIFCL